MTELKVFLFGIPSIMISAITAIFGGWDTGLQVYLVLCILDLVIGTINAFMGKSDKTKSGAFNSSISWKGFGKKLITLILIAAAHWIDVVLGTTVVRDSSVLFFIFNEGTSILEHAGHWIDLPPVIKRALDVLKSKSDDPKVD